jgi:hypothetical protein
MGGGGVYFLFALQCIGGGGGERGGYLSFLYCWGVGSTVTQRAW